MFCFPVAETSVCSRRVTRIRLKDLILLTSILQDGMSPTTQPWIQISIPNFAVGNLWSSHNISSAEIKEPITVDNPGITETWPLSFDMVLGTYRDSVPLWVIIACAVSDRSRTRRPPVARCMIVKTQALLWQCYGDIQKPNPRVGLVEQKLTHHRYTCQFMSGYPRVK